MSVLFQPRSCFTLHVLKKLATQLILPYFDYADVVYQNASKTNLLPLNTAYNNFCKFVLGCSFNTHHCTMYNSLKWPSLNVRRHIHWLQLVKCVHFNYPHPYLQQFLVPCSSIYQLRHSTQ